MSASDDERTSLEVETSIVVDYRPYESCQTLNASSDDLNQSSWFRTQIDCWAHIAMVRFRPRASSKI